MIDVSKLDFLGRVNVDTGTLIITDPCDVNQEAANTALERSPLGDAVQIPHTDGTPDCALVVSGWGGDGFFGVYAVRDESGMVAQIVIDFDGTAALVRENAARAREGGAR